MRALAANIEEVFREAAARWTLLAYFALSSLFILLFAVAVNLDIVNGALAGAKIFGANVHMGRQSVDLDKLVLGFDPLGGPFIGRQKARLHPGWRRQGCATEIVTGFDIPPETLHRF